MTYDSNAVGRLNRELECLVGTGNLTEEAWRDICLRAVLAVGERADALEMFENEADPAWIRRWNEEEGE